MSEIEWIDDRMEAAIAELNSSFYCYRTEDELNSIHQKVEAILKESMTEMMLIELTLVSID